MKRPMPAVLTAVLLLSACVRGEAVESPAPRPPAARVVREAPRVPAVHEVTAGADWYQAGSDAVLTALPVDPSFHELFALPSDRPAALAWALHLHASERVEVTVTAEERAAVPFLDVFERLPDGRYELITSAPKGADRLEIAARRDGEYVLRVQPEPGAGGRYRVSVKASGVSVMFPVAGADAGAIRSGYGDARDGGARSHDGVDIFAPRGTPVIAVADAIVDAVQNTGAGGKVIWAKAEDGSLLYYYAHLEEQLVEAGAHIGAGDTIGRVGNSGNASGASPHLHFGVYRPGDLPVDPLAVIGRRTTGLLALPDTAAESVGARAQTRGSSVRLRTSPGGGRILAELEQGTMLRVVGALGEWRRVVLDDGRAGFIMGRLLQPATAAQ